MTTNTPRVPVEADYWPQIAETWRMRAASERLKPGTKRYADQQCAYLQGALAALTTTGLMTMDRAHQMAFFVAIGRADELLKWHEKQPA